MAVEVWKAVKGFEGLYEVSNLGRVKSYHKNGCGHLLKFSKSTWGYFLVGLHKNGKMKTFSVHRLVAEAFVQNPENKRCVNHIDCNKTNNCASNLEWTTQLENVNHSVKLGHYEKVGAERKSVNQYDNEGKLLNSFCSVSEAARKTGIIQSNISKCCNGHLHSAGGYVWKFAESGDEFVS